MEALYLIALLLSVDVGHPHVASQHVETLEQAYLSWWMLDASLANSSGAAQRYVSLIPNLSTFLHVADSICPSRLTSLIAISRTVLLLLPRLNPPRKG